ncbi:hypothetical protein NB475_18075 [Vibrio alginolyticus]|nr:hypothetical protein [Vibrio alginolyticus]
MTGSNVTFAEPESIPTEDKTPWSGRTASVSSVKRGKSCKHKTEKVKHPYPKRAKVSTKVSENKNFKENKSIKRYKTRQRKQLTVEEAKGIIKRLYSQADKWDDPEFKMAFRRLTGQSKVMSLSEAKGVVYQWYHFEAKRYQLEYSIACLLLSGIWIAPKTRLKEGMSKQIQARCDRRDLNAGFKGSWVYRN